MFSWLLCWCWGFPVPYNTDVNQWKQDCKWVQPQQYSAKVGSLCEPHPKGDVGVQTPSYSRDSMLYVRNPFQHTASICEHFVRCPAHSRYDSILRSECTALYGCICQCVSWIHRLQFNMKYELVSQSPEVPIRQIKCMSGLPLPDDVWALFIYLWLLLIILTNRLSIWEVRGKFIYIILSISRSFL